MPHPSRLLHIVSCSTAAARNVSPAAKQDFLVRALQQLGELGNRRRFARAVDAGDQDHRRSGR